MLGLSSTWSHCVTESKMLGLEINKSNLCYLDLIFFQARVWWVITIVLKPGPARRVNLRPGRPGAGTGPGWRNNRGRKNPVWPSWPDNPIKNPVKTIDFCFFTKTTSFWFFFKKNWPGWPGRNPEPGLWTRPGLKAMVITLSFALKKKWT